MSALSLAMIVKNEERCIERCLASFRPFVDQILILDTGSTDATLVKARQFGAEIHSFEWCDDFSKARNAALSHVTCDFSLIVDADEWLMEGGEHLLQAETWAKDAVKRINRVNSFILNGKIEKNAEWITRILPKGVLYEGRIHEQPIHDLKIEQLPVKIGHDGYLTEQLGRKSDRNERLLKQALIDQPENGYYYYQLGKEYENAHFYDQAGDNYAIALDMVPKTAGFRHDLVVRAIYAFKQARRFDAALTLIDRKEWDASPDFHFAAGDALLDFALAYPEKAPRVLPIIEFHWLKCLEIGDVDHLDATVIGRGSFLAAQNLYAFYISQGRNDLADTFASMAAQLRPQPVIN